MQQRQRGFTLIELMVTIAVLAIVVAIAAPSFTTMINNNRSVALGEELTNAINYARAEAVKRGAKVSICASSDGTSCGNDWTQGWIVVADSQVGASGAPSFTAPDDVLRAWEAPSSGAVITVTRGGAGANFIRFVRLGTIEPNGAATVASNVSGCKGNAGRTITVGPAGLVNVARSNANCS